MAGQTRFEVQYVRIPGLRESPAQLREIAALNACPYCARPWDQHTPRCEAGVPEVDLHDERGLAGRIISGYQILGGIGKGGWVPSTSPWTTSPRASWMR